MIASAWGYLTDASRIARLGLVLAASVLAFGYTVQAGAADAVLREGSCARLAALVLTDAKVVAAEVVAAGSFRAPGSPALPPAFGLEKLPEFCRVSIAIHPTPASDIRMEVWLPTKDWNGRFLAVGNGGFWGAMPYGFMGEALGRNFATAGTDTGHQGSAEDGSFALNHPERLIDFAYRAVHEMTVRAKTVIAAHYGSAPKYSYWNGCSSGGKQGLKEAQRFPEDFDGIVAGSPANNWVRLVTAELHQASRVLPQGSPQYIPPAKYPLLYRGALAACDALDGVTDGAIEDPRACSFDPAQLACKAGVDHATCLTAPQIEAARAVYAPLRYPRTGEYLFAGMPAGSELNWQILIGGPGPFGLAENHYRYIVHRNPSWDWRTLDFAADFALAERIDNGSIAATDPDLSAFRKRGGKLIQYHGWSDSFIPAGNSIDYYESVVAKANGASRAQRLGEVQSFYRLFMVPGMDHCIGGGPSADNFDMLSPLMDWVERGVAPESVQAQRHATGRWFDRRVKGEMVNLFGPPPADPKVDRTRPLCPYPQVARYTGRGSPDDAASFACIAPVPIDNDVAVDQVQIDSGRLRGVSENGVVAFKGIPYAKPPIGKRRWREPEPVSKWQGVRDAKDFSASCRQARLPGAQFGPYTWEYLVSGPLSEDCLYLNVWKPAQRARDRLPVFVWIHGGAYQMGSGSVALYDGAALARRGIVVVSINYRLGVFGFLAHKELSRESAHGNAGNYGLLDVAAALRWVRENASAFGGDPERVTIGGQSAGGDIVNIMSSSPHTRGLFSAAIVQSAPLGFVPQPSLSDASAVGSRLVKAVEVHSIRELREVPAEKVEAAAQKLAASSAPRHDSLPVLLFTPVVDGWLLPATTREILERGESHDIPTIAGITADETDPAGLATNAMEHTAAAQRWYGDRATRFLELYPASTDAEAAVSAKAARRDAALAAVLWWAEQRARAGVAPFFVYYYTHVEPGPTADRYGAFHSSEIGYVLDTLAKTPERPFTARDRAISNTMTAYWARFIGAGNPNSSDLPDWPVASESGTQVMELGERFGPRPAPSAERLEFFREYLRSGGAPTLF